MLYWNLPLADWDLQIALVDLNSDSIALVADVQPAVLGRLNYSRESVMIPLRSVFPRCFDSLMESSDPQRLDCRMGCWQSAQG